MAVEKLKQITDKEWAEVNPVNRVFVEEFITNSVELSPQTLKAYTSNLRIWFVWVKDNLNNKPETDIKPLEYKRFQNWLINRGCSSSDTVNKRAAISSLNNFIEIYMNDEYPLFRNFINKSIKRPVKEFVNEKEYLNHEELEHLVAVLREREEWQKVAYVLFTFETGCRRAESRQLMKDIVDTKPIIKEKDGKTITYYLTPNIRCKGAGKTGKIRKLMFGEEAMNALKKWVEERGEDDCPYMFVSKNNGKCEQITGECFNKWAQDVFTPICGKRVTPHSFRRSRASQAVVEDGIDIESVRVLLGHESSDTTRIYVMQDESEEIDDLFA